MKLVWLPIPVITILLSGCATNLISMQQEQAMGVPVDMPEPLRAAPVSQQSAVVTRRSAVLMPPLNSYQPRYTHKKLDDYAEQITMELMKRARSLHGGSRVGIASFVELDASLETTSPLGNQLAESFIKEVQEYGVPVVDFKTRGGVRVTPSGDLAFSRDSWDLSKVPLDYVLSGTMLRNEKGVNVSARIVSVDDNVVVASASGFIPHFVVNSVIPEYVIIEQ